MKIFLMTLSVWTAVAALVGIATSAEARGHAWFVKNTRPGSACSPAQPTTYYGEGHRNADGSSFNRNGHSAASVDYPFGTILRVVNSQNGAEVLVTVKDRGPARWIYNLGIHLDISLGAARAIHLGQNGRFESGWTCVSVVSLGSAGQMARTRGDRRPIAAQPTSRSTRVETGT